MIAAVPEAEDDAAERTTGAGPTELRVAFPVALAPTVATPMVGADLPASDLAEPPTEADAVTAATRPTVTLAALPTAPLAVLVDCLPSVTALEAPTVDAAIVGLTIGALGSQCA